MRRAVTVVMLAAFLVVALVMPAVAATKPLPGRIVKVTGVVKWGNIGKPHFELKTANNQSYVLMPNDKNIGKYAGKTVIVKGYEHRGPSIWMKPVIKVVSVKPLGPSNFKPVAR